MRRLLTETLPRGTVAVGAGLAVLGAASYVQLAAAGHGLDPAGMSNVSVIWSIVFSLGLGLFFPIEQEVSRIVSAGATRGEGAGPALRHGAVLAGGILALLWLVLAAAARPIADALFDGNLLMVAGLAGAFLGCAASYATRGVLGGSGRFGVYGVQLGIDGTLRAVRSIGLAVAGVRSALPYVLVLTVAPVVSVVATLPPVLRLAGAGPALSWRAFCRGLGLLTVSTLSAQAVVNVAVVSVRLLDPKDQALAGALLSALVLARVPLFVFGSLQAALLPGLSSAAALGDMAGYRRLLARAVGIVVGLAVLGGVPAIVIGPWLVRVFFDAPPVLTAGDFAVLAAATLCYMLALVLGQGAMSVQRHREQALAWLAGLAVLVAVTLAPGPVKLRVELAYGLASLTVAAILAGVLWHARPRRRVPPPAPAYAAQEDTR